MAVKILFCIELTPERVISFCHEASVLHALRHTNIVQCVGVAVMPPAICLVGLATLLVRVEVIGLPVTPLLFLVPLLCRSQSGVIMGPCMTSCTLRSTSCETLL